MADLSLEIVEAQPSEAGVIHFLPLAAAQAGGVRKSQVNLHLRIKNTASATVRIRKIQLTATGASSPTAEFDTDFSIAASGTAGWTQPADCVMTAVPTGMTIRFENNSGESTSIPVALAPHVNPPSAGCYHFWASPHDLRHDEFWYVHGTSHGQENKSQLFGYDVGVAAVAAQSDPPYNHLLPGTDGSFNEHFRVWGKSIRAMAAGKVVDFRNDYPTNALPGAIDPLAEAYWKGGTVVDGNGNFFTIESGGETLLYAHMQPGSLSPKLLAAGAVVQAGEFLGLAGNSGASGAPHVHIHAVQTGSGSHSWTGHPRPTLFNDVWAVAFNAHGGNDDTAPWVKVTKRGIAAESCAVWPRAIKPVKRLQIFPKHFTISAQGQLWVRDTLDRIRTTSARLPLREVYLDTEPGGSAQRLAVRGTKPCVIGSDSRIWEGRPEGWFVLPGSPLCTRLALDPANGTPWVVRQDRHILRFDLAQQTWAEHAGGGLAKDICIAQGTPYVIGDDDKIWKSSGAAGWARLAGDRTATRLVSDPSDGKLWLLDAAGGVWSGSGNGTWSAYVVVPGTQSSAVSSEIAAVGGRPYVRGPDKALWMGSPPWGWWRVRLVGPAGG